MTNHRLSFIKVAEILFIAAVFFVGWRASDFTAFDFSHVADVLFVLSGVSALLSREFRNFVREKSKRFAPFLKLITVVVGFIIIGQFLSFLRFAANPFTSGVITDHLRLIFNFGIFFLVSILVFRNQKVLIYTSISILASFVLVLPVYFVSDQTIFFAGARLAGLILNPIIFGAMAVTAFIIALGFAFEKWNWGKVFLVAGFPFLAALILWSGARAAWISFLLSLVLFIVILYKQKEWKKLKLALFIIIFAFGVGYFLIGNNRKYNVPADNMRSFLNSRAIEMATSPKPYYENRVSFWLGNTNQIYKFPFGFGFMDPNKKDHYPGFTSTFLEILVYGGVVVLLAFLAILWKIGRGVLESLKGAMAQKSQYLVISWLIVGVALFINIAPFNFFLTRVFWLLLGIIAGVVIDKIPGDSKLFSKIISKKVHPDK